MECIMWMSRDRLRRCGPMAALGLLAAGIAWPASDHTEGFARYAHVGRPDGAYREMLADEAMLRAGGRAVEGGTILMESYYTPGVVGSVFAKRWQGGRWLFASFRPGEPLPEFRPLPQCATCHRAAAATGGTFTRAMLERFAADGKRRQAFCGRPGRPPCPPDVYAAPAGGSQP
jgi:hypothetical protein